MNDALRDPSTRDRQDRVAQLRQFLSGGWRAHQDALAADAIDGLDDDFVEAIRHFAVGRILQPSGVHVWQDRLLLQELVR